MKSIQICLLSFFLIVLYSNTSAQNDFYNEDKKTGKTEITTQKEGIDNDAYLEEYYTESDYYDKNNIKNNQEYNPSEVIVEDDGFYDDEIYEEEKPRRRRNVAGEVAAEIFVDVIINTAFIIAAFWH